MTMMKSAIKLMGAAALLAMATMGQAAAVECIAPADPGGGWDFTCRTVGKLLYDEKLMEEPVQVTNMPGGVGAVAYVNIMSKRPADAAVIVATSTVGVTQIAQGKYPAGTDAMRWIGMLGTDVGAIVVAKDSPYKTLDDLMKAFKENPGSVVSAGSSGAGGWDHIRLLMLAKAAGMAPEKFKQIRWVQFDGGSPAVTQMMGGQVQVVSTDLGEIAGFVESGDARILGVLSDDPIPTFPDAPTAKSQGLNVTGYNWRGFYTGGDVSDEDYKKWVDTMKSLFDTEAWKKAAEGSGLVPIWRGGEEFEAYVIDQAKQMEQISKEIGVL